VLFVPRSLQARTGRPAGSHTTGPPPDLAGWLAAGPAGRRLLLDNRHATSGYCPAYEGAEISWWQLLLALLMDAGARSDVLADGESLYELLAGGGVVLVESRESLPNSSDGKWTDEEEAGEVAALQRAMAVVIAEEEGDGGYDHAELGGSPEVSALPTVLEERGDEEETSYSKPLEGLGEGGEHLGSQLAREIVHSAVDAAHSRGSSAADGDDALGPAVRHPPDAEGRALSDWLTAAGAGFAWHRFVAEGFQSVRSVCEAGLTEVDLRELGLVKMRARKSLMAAIQASRTGGSAPGGRLGRRSPARAAAEQGVRGGQGSLEGAVRELVRVLEPAVPAVLAHLEKLAASSSTSWSSAAPSSSLQPPAGSSAGGTGGTPLPIARPMAVRTRGLLPHHVTTAGATTEPAPPTAPRASVKAVGQGIGAAGVTAAGQPLSEAKRPSVSELRARFPTPPPVGLPPVQPLAGPPASASATGAAAAVTANSAAAAPASLPRDSRPPRRAGEKGSGKLPAGRLCAADFAAKLEEQLSGESVGWMVSPNEQEGRARSSGGGGGWGSVEGAVAAYGGAAARPIPTDVPALQQDIREATLLYRARVDPHQRPERLLRNVLCVADEGLSRTGRPSGFVDARSLAGLFGEVLQLFVSAEEAEALCEAHTQRIITMSREAERWVERRGGGGAGAVRGGGLGGRRLTTGGQAVGGRLGRIAAAIPVAVGPTLEYDSFARWLMRPRASGRQRRSRPVSAA
jgi:hypothetical protein